MKKKGRKPHNKRVNNSNRQQGLSEWTYIHIITYSYTRSLNILVSFHTNIYTPPSCACPRTRTSVCVCVSP